MFGRMADCFGPAKCNCRATVPARPEAREFAHQWRLAHHINESGDAQSDTPMNEMKFWSDKDAGECAEAYAESRVKEALEKK